MTKPCVTIIVPAYNQAAYVGEAIESVLRQTYRDWELIVVDDGSTDETAAIIATFDDPRIRYIHQANKGLPGARNTGIAHSRGDYLAFLDADDFYHQEKLAVQVAHLQQNPEIGLSYSGRIHIDQEGTPIWIYRSSNRVGLHDLVLDFPFTINDFLIRRSLVEAVGGFDESYRLHGEDRDFYLRLALAGCQFGGTKRALAYRRLHAHRVYKGIPERISIMLRALETAFNDPRCPQDVMTLREQAYGKIYLVWAYYEFAQEETDLALQHLQEALRLNPSYLEHGADPLSRFLSWISISSNEEHEATLRRVIEQLPNELAVVKFNSDRIVAQSYLIKAMRRVIWGELPEACQDIARAKQLNCNIDQTWITVCTDQLTAYEAEFGAEAADQVLRNLATTMSTVKGGRKLRQLRGSHAGNRAFKQYSAGAYCAARANVLRAFYYTPHRITNRGMLSVLVRSFLKPTMKRLSTT
jgi:glycosyltransferase involved in cell wall biosynthesis